MPQQVYMSCGAFIPPHAHAWCMHGPFVKHVCIPEHSHGLHNHPGGLQDNGMMPSSCHAQLLHSVPLPRPLLSSLSSSSRTCCMPKCVPSASPVYSPCCHMSGVAPGVSSIRYTTNCLCYMHWLSLFLSYLLVFYQ